MPYTLDSTEEQFTIPTADNGTLCCILRKPRALLEDEYAHNLGPATHRCAILIHGNSSHKNFCFAVQLAANLSDRLGMYSVRFDFRNCGDSSKNGKLGRTVKQDLQDIEAVYHHLVSGGWNSTPLVVDTLVGHSRGVVDMFEWAMQHNSDPSHYVPTLVAAAGRFIGSGLVDRIREQYPAFEQEGGHTEPAVMDGAYSTVYVPASETFDLGSRDMDHVHELNPDVDTLCVYGTRDGAIPLSDAALYANALQGRNKLVLINGIDHRFYGVDKLTEQEAGKFKEPYCARTGVLNYNQDVADTITEFIGHNAARKRFYDSHRLIHAFLPRWKEVAGVANFRDIGGYTSAKYPSKHVRYNIAFRCADPGSITKEGLQEVSGLGVTTVFDLRSDFERGESSPLSGEGISNVHVPLLDEQSLAPADAMLFYTSLLQSWFAFTHTYAEILSVATPQFKIIFTHIRDHPGEPFVFHCTAGKDRTGVVAMLILRLLGVAPAVVAREYEMTEYGLLPARPKVQEGFLRNLHEHGNEQSREQLRKVIVKGRKNWTLEQDGFDNLLSSRYEVMVETMRLLDLKYGGVEAYLMNQVGMTEQDLETIRRGLLV